MKKIILLVFLSLSAKIGLCQTTPLKGVTFSIGLGWNYLGKTPKEYFLSTDNDHKLQRQNLSKSSIVISSLVTIKLGDLSIQNQQKGGVSKQKLVSTNRISPAIINSKGWAASPFFSPGVPPVPVAPPTNESPHFSERLAINIGFNLAEINDGNI